LDEDAHNFQKEDIFMNYNYVNLNRCLSLKRIGVIISQNHCQWWSTKKNTQI